jgi:GNAT superfamily N-acetyltransferase
VALIAQVDGSPAEAEAITEQILLEYLTWCRERFTADHAVVFDDPQAAMAAHHREFTQELPNLLGPRGRLLVAWKGSEVVGVGALKPIDAGVAEIKRMYVRPQARGRGIARAILERLLADARALGYQLVRLETATFMHEAHALYRSLGFKDRQAFDHAEAGLSGLDQFVLYMELRLDQTARV